MLELVQAGAKLRAAGDRELSRRWPCWFCVMFHRVAFDDAACTWELVYSVQMCEGAEPMIAKIELWQGSMMDGSPAFIPVGIL